MAEHPNAAVVRAFFDALARGDVETSSQLLSPDLVWRLPCAGTVLGEQRDLVGLDGVTASTVANLTTTDGTFSFDVGEIYAGDEYAVAISRNTARGRDKVLDIKMAISMRIAGGKIVEVWEAPDDIDAFADFWAEN